LDVVTGQPSLLFWGSQTTFSRSEASRIYGATSWLGRGGWGVGVCVKEGAVLGGSLSGRAGSFLVSVRIYRYISASFTLS